MHGWQCLASHQTHKQTLLYRFRVCSGAVVPTRLGHEQVCPAQQCMTMYIPNKRIEWLVLRNLVVIVLRNYLRWRVAQRSAEPSS